MKNKKIKIILLAVFAILTAAGIGCIIYGFDCIDYMRREEKSVEDVIFGSEDDFKNVRAKGELNMPIEKIEDGYYVFCLVNNAADPANTAVYTVFGVKAGPFDSRRIDAIIEYVDEESKEDADYDGASNDMMFEAAGEVRKMRVSEKEKFDETIKDYNLVSENISIYILDCRYDSDLAIFCIGVIAVIAGICGIVLSAPESEKDKKDKSDPEKKQEVSAS